MFSTTVNQPLYHPLYHTFSTQVHKLSSEIQRQYFQNGIILRPSTSYELKSLNNRLKTILNAENSSQISSENLHIVKIIDNYVSDSYNFFVKYPGQPESIRVLSQKLLATPVNKARNSTIFKQRVSRKSKRSTKERKTTVEIAVFFDAAAYRIFAPHFNYDNNKIRDMLLAYINGVIMKFQLIFYKSR